jgi:hypothetical protein
MFRVECALTYDCGSFGDQHALVPQIFLHAMRNDKLRSCVVLEVGSFSQKEEGCQRMARCRLRAILVAFSQDTSVDLLVA